MHVILKRSRQWRQPGPGPGAARTRLRNTVPRPDHSGRLAVQALPAGGLAERLHISPGELPGRRKLHRGWRRRQLAPSTPPGETILRTQIYSATAMLVTSQATIADCSSPQLSVQNLPICTPPIGGSEWPTSTQIFNKADILPAQMYVGISQPENWTGSG